MKRICKVPQVDSVYVIFHRSFGRVWIEQAGKTQAKSSTMITHNAIYMEDETRSHINSHLRDKHAGLIAYLAEPRIVASTLLNLDELIDKLAADK